MDSNERCTDGALGDLLAAYEMGLLEEQDRLTVEQHLAECASCQDELYATAPYAREMRADPRRYRQTIAAAAPDIGGPNRVLGLVMAAGRYLQSLVTWRVGVPVATVAAVALVLIVVGRDDGFDPRTLAVIEPVAYVQIDTRSGATPQLSASFRAGMAAYDEQRYADAAGILTDTLALAGQDSGWPHMDQARFYQGLSYLLAGDAGSAIEALEKTTNSPVRPLADRSRWYLAQALLLHETPRAALTPLQDLADNSPLYAERAAAQLRSLQEALENE